MVSSFFFIIIITIIILLLIQIIMQYIYIQGWATSGYIRNSGFFFLLSWKKKPEPGKLTIFLSGKKWRYDPTVLQTCYSSRFFSTNLEASLFPYSICENPRFLFCFEIGKTKRRLTLLHVPCLQAHKAWPKKRLNPFHSATQRVR